VLSVARRSPPPTRKERRWVARLTASPGEGQEIAPRGLRSQDVARRGTRGGPMVSLLATLAVLGPVVVHASGEPSPVTSVEAFRGGSAPPAVYERVVRTEDGRWRQWWLLFAHNAQDRGILRTGRHAGDWELVQVREDAPGRPVEAVYAQHSGAERCPWSAVRQRG